jgi:hypothetical protein
MISRRQDGSARQAFRVCRHHSSVMRTVTVERLIDDGPFHVGDEYEVAANDADEHYGTRLVGLVLVAIAVIATIATARSPDLDGIVSLWQLYLPRHDETGGGFGAQEDHRAIGEQQGLGATGARGIGTSSPQQLRGRHHGQHEYECSADSDHAP